MEELVLGEYRLEQELGSGSFGRVLKGVSVTSHAQVAIKLEPREKGKPRLLREESDVMSALQGGVGIPKMLGRGKFKNQTCLVMELLGPTIQSKFRQMGRVFAFKTVMEIADQALERIEYMHSHFYLHRDIKPQNFMFGIGPQQSILYLSDFGLAKKYQNGAMGLHIPYREDKSFVGTACYASLNTHLGVQQSRRDDVESLIYVICYLLRGSLPWANRFTGPSAKHSSTKMQKMLIRPDELFAGFAKGFAQMLLYVRGMQFDDRPDYVMLRNTFRSMAAERSIVINKTFEWMERERMMVKSSEASSPKKRKLIRGQSANPKRDKRTNLTQTTDEKVFQHQRSLLTKTQPESAPRVRFGDIPDGHNKDSADDADHTSFHATIDDENSSEGTVKDTRGPTINRTLISTRNSTCKDKSNVSAKY